MYKHWLLIQLRIRNQEGLRYTFVFRTLKGNHMKRKFICLIAASILTASLFMAPEALAKKWTVTERIQKLSQEIETGRKANELTSKQVESLKVMVANINGKIEKMQAKNGGKLSIPDTKKLHDEMTDISVKMLKMRLDNVYEN